MEKVSIILVNYNGSKDTIECIESILKSTYKNFCIIIVDNKSYKYEFDLLNNYILSENNSKIILIKGDYNLGFAGGNNIGIKEALKLNSDYVFLLNNDTLIEKNTIEYILRDINNIKNCGIIAPKICYYPDTKRIWYAGGRINWRKCVTIHLGEKKIDNGNYDKIKKTDFITGCAMFIKLDVVKKVGFMPKEYFMYFEDVDYCEMIKKAGYYLYFDGNAKIYHKVSASSGGEESAFSIEYGTRNRKYFITKYKKEMGIFNYISSMFYLYLTRIIKIIIFAFKGDTDKMHAVINGLKGKVINNE